MRWACRSASSSGEKQSGCRSSPRGEPAQRLVTKRRRLFLLTNSALVIRVQMRGEEGSCGVSANDYSCANHVPWSPNKLWRSTSIFNLCCAAKPSHTVRKGFFTVHGREEYMRHKSVDALQRKFHLCILFSGNCAASVPISTFMCLWAIYTDITRIGPNISLQQNRQTILEIYKSLTDIWVWELGNRIL